MNGSKLKWKFSSAAAVATEKVATNQPTIRPIKQFTHIFGIVSTLLINENVATTTTTTTKNWN